MSAYVETRCYIYNLHTGKFLITLVGVAPVILLIIMDALYRVTTIGEDSVGKTWLLRTFVDELQPGYIVPATIGIDFCIKTVTISNKRRIKLQLWDTSGHERFRTITFAYFRRRPGFLVVFDSTRKKTFDLAINYWLKKIEEHCTIPNPVIYLVGTKCEMEDEREVSQERAQIVADELGLKYFEVSSYLRYNVDLVFQTLAQDMDEIHRDNKQLIDVKVR